MELFKLVYLGTPLAHLPFPYRMDFFTWGPPLPGPVGLRLKGLLVTNNLVLSSSEIICCITVIYTVNHNWLFVVSRDFVKLVIVAFMIATPYCWKKIVKKDTNSLGARCSRVKWAVKSSVTWLGSPPGTAAHTGHTWNITQRCRQVHNDISVSCTHQNVSRNENSCSYSQIQGCDAPIKTKFHVFSISS